MLPEERGLKIIVRQEKVLAIMGDQVPKPRPGGEEAAEAPEVPDNHRVPEAPEEPVKTILLYLGQLMASQVGLPVGAAGDRGMFRNQIRLIRAAKAEAAQD